MVNIIIEINMTLTEHTSKLSLAKLSILAAMGISAVASASAMEIPQDSLFTHCPDLEVLCVIEAMPGNLRR